MKKKNEPLLYRLIATSTILSGLIELICWTEIDNEHTSMKKWESVCECMFAIGNVWKCDLTSDLLTSCLQWYRYKCNHIHVLLHHLLTRSIRHTCTFTSYQFNSQSTPPFFHKSNIHFKSMNNQRYSLDE